MLIFARSILFLCFLHLILNKVNLKHRLVKDVRAPSNFWSRQFNIYLFFNLSFFLSIIWFILNSTYDLPLSFIRVRLAALYSVFLEGVSDLECVKFIFFKHLVLFTYSFSVDNRNSFLGFGLWLQWHGWFCHPRLCLFQGRVSWVWSPLLLWLPISMLLFWTNYVSATVCGCLIYVSRIERA